MEDDNNQDLMGVTIPEDTPVELIDVPPGKSDDEYFRGEETPNPFNQSEAPFDNATKEFLDGLGKPQETPVATPLRTMTMGMATMDPDQINDEYGLHASLARSIAAAEETLEMGGEYQKSLEVASQRLLRNREAILALPQTDPIISEELGASIGQAARENVATDIEEARKAVLEEEAVRNIITLFDAGDDVGFRMALNNLRPEKATTAGVIQDNLVKSLVVANAIERAQLDEQEEGFWNKFFTTITSIPEAIALGEMFQRLGNVDEGAGGYTENFWRWLTPGSEFARQAEAVQGMNAKELSDYMPTLLENIKNNSTTFGLTDPGRNLYLLTQLTEGVNGLEAGFTDLFNIAEIALFLPVGKAAQAIRGTEIMVGAGARKAAGERIAAAINDTVEGGESLARRTVGVTTREIEDHVLPRAVNPNKSVDNVITVPTKRSSIELPQPTGPSVRARALAGDNFGVTITPIKRTFVSLSGEVSSTMRAARLVLDGDPENGITGLRAMTSSARFFDDVELQKAVESRKNWAEKLTGSGVADFDVTKEALPNGSEVNRVNVVFDKKFATEQEANNWLRTNALPTGDEHVIWREAGGQTAQAAPEAAPLRILSAGDQQRVDALETRLTEVGPRSREAKAIRQELNDLKGNTPEAPKPVGDSEIIQDVSGAFYARANLDIPETAFYTSELNPPRTGVIGRFVKNSSQLLDRRLFEQATEASNRRQALLAKVQRKFLKDYAKLSGKDRAYLKQVIMKGENMGKWFTDKELSVLWQRARGVFPSEAVETSYRNYQILNDAEYLMRNADLYATKQIRGFQSAKFNVLGEDYDIDALVDISLSSAPNRRVFDASTGTAYTRRNPLTASRAEELEGQGYVMIKPEKAIKLPDGTTVDHLLIKKQELELSPLRRGQLSYTPGGHRLYADKYFVKQAVRGRQPDTGEEFLENPNAFVTAPNIRDARRWADKMNEARLLAKAGNVTAQQLDETVFQAQKGFPTGQQFLDDLENGRISKDEPFEAVFDREMPSAYVGTGEDVSKFMDDEEVGFGGFYRTNGKMYYSAKGDQLHRYDGDLAPTVDPFEAQSQALYNVSQLSSFNDFKVSSTERWASNYKKYLAEGDRDMSAMDLLFNGTVKKDVDFNVRQQIDAQRESIMRILNHRSEFDLAYRQFLRNRAEWMIGDSDNAVRKFASDAVLGMMDKNPINFLRGMAFDMKLGMLNIGQFFLQTSTMFSAMAMSPKAGLKGFLTHMPMRAYSFSGRSEAVLDKLIERGWHSYSGFKDAKEFKNYVKNATDSGFFDIGNTHAMVNNAGPDSTFAISSKVNALREHGRFFFYEAEQANRVVAYRIAYDEAVERFGTTDFNNAQFRRYIQGRAENYSFNMSEHSKSFWQSGVLSVPTQFWAYNVRMIEALTGSNFSNQQKLRLALMQFGMAGTGGIPLAGLVTDYINAQRGEAPEVDSLEGFFQRGVIDLAVHELTGADVQISEKWGTGDFATNTIKDIFGMSQYGATSVADFTGGATYSILGETLGSAAEIAHYWAAHESGGEAISLNGDQWERLFRQIATFNNSLKAIIIYKYGMLETTKGSTTVAGLPKSSILFTALGFNPGELRDMEAMGVYDKNRKESVDEAAKFINGKLGEGIHRPDTFETNAKEVNAFVQLLPPDIKMDVLKQVQAYRDPSLYDSMLRRRERRQAVETFNENISNEENN